MGKYVKVRFESMGSPCYLCQFSMSKDQKYYKSWTKETVFVYILCFIFNGVSRAKTDLHNKYMI